MAILNSDHLLEQADRLIIPPPAGPPRQIDLRRAISAAYYAVFHFILTQVADEFVGKTMRSTKRYTLVYRSIDHRALKELCAEVKKTTLAAKYQRYDPPSGFGPNIQAFATVFLELQEKRHSADYDPSIRVKTSDAKIATATARRAIIRFSAASSTRRKTFVTLLLCPPR